MLLHCNIEIYDRILSSRRKSQRSILAFIKIKDDVYFCFSTRSNKQGVKYKVIFDVDSVINHFDFSQNYIRNKLQYLVIVFTISKLYAVCWKKCMIKHNLFFILSDKKQHKKSVHEIY